MLVEKDIRIRLAALLNAQRSCNLLYFLNPGAGNVLHSSGEREYYSFDSSSVTMKSVRSYWFW